MSRQVASGLTFDTGVLVALERRKQRAWKIYREAMRRKVPITVPTPVIAEWWRGRSDAREHVKSGLHLEWLSDAIAELAGEALAAVVRSTVVDAIVMASAASRGDVVYTSDFEDLDRLRAFFPSVRVLEV
jgi:predicted nucleic acid-binding protein